MVSSQSLSEEGVTEVGGKVVVGVLLCPRDADGATSL
jgi:hypothetical protein